MAGWTKETGTRLLTRECFQNESEAEAKWKRATLTSTQLLTYFVGYSEHTALRDEVRRREGMVEDVDAVYARLKGKAELVHEPKLLPWGNRSVQFRDPEGTVVSLFTPVTEGAKERFGSR